MHRNSSQKLAFDLLLLIFVLFVLSTTILCVSNVNWTIDSDGHRIGLFQRCAPTCCCTFKELNRTVTLLILLGVALLLVSTLTSILLMATSTETSNRCYMLVPLTLFGAGATMTLALIHLLDGTSVNGYSAFIFIVNTVLAYVLAGIAIIHGSVFYFR